MYMHNTRRAFCLLCIKKDTFARIYTWRAIEAALVVLLDTFHHHSRVSRNLAGRGLGQNALVAPRPLCSAGCAS